MNNTQKGTMHIIGIGGIGMSAIADILHNSNYKVQGSDMRSNDSVDKLQKLVIKVYIGHNANNIRQAKVVVQSSATRSDNVELIAARENNKTILHRLSGITDVTLIVEEILNSYRSNSKLSKGDIFLIEADESDGIMLKIPANIAVITSINNDHIDHYGTFDNLKNAFSQFVNEADFAILPDSADISCDTRNSITFGFKNGSIRVSNIKQCVSNVKFDVLINNNHRIKNVVLSNAVGIHKVSSALAAISIAVKLGISDAYIKKGLLEFKGIARRFSLITDVKGVKLIEDYAHHPSEIQATLAAACLITKQKVIGIVEPLRFACTRNLFNEFVQVFMMFNHVILTPIYPSEDEPISDCGIDDIQKALISKGFSNVETMNNAFLISHFINNSTNSGDVVLFIGADNNIAKLARETVALTLEVEV